MQRKTKFKIIFYSIGFISFALLPYVLTQNSADDTQRFAPLPSYNTSDSAHPFLSRLKGAASRLFSWGKQDPQSDAQQAVNAIDADTAAALNKATTNEVLASLTPAKKSTTQTKTLAAAGSPEAQAAAAAAEEQQAAAEEAQAEQAKNAALFAAAPSAAYAGTSPNSPRANALNAQGRNQNYSGAYNNLPRGSKSGSLADLIAQNDARLVQMNLFSPANARAAIRRSRAAGKNKGSYKARFAKASNALKNAAVSRARAKTYTYGYAGTPAAAITINSPEVQREMMLQTQELNSIFDQQLTLAIEDSGVNENTRINELGAIMSLSPTPSATLQNSGDTDVKNIAGLSPMASEENKSRSVSSSTGEPPTTYIPSAFEHKNGLPDVDSNPEDDSDFDDSEQAEEKLVFVLDHNTFPAKATPLEDLDPGKKEVLDRQYQTAKEATSAISGDGPSWQIASDSTNKNDIESLSKILDKSIGIPLGSDIPKTSACDELNYCPKNDKDMRRIIASAEQMFVFNLPTAKEMLPLADPNDPTPLAKKILVNPYSLGGSDTEQAAANAVPASPIPFAAWPSEQIQDAYQSALELSEILMDAKAAADEDAANTVIVTEQTKEALNNKK